MIIGLRIEDTVKAAKYVVDTQKRLKQMLFLPSARIRLIRNESGASVIMYYKDIIPISPLYISMFVTMIMVLFTGLHGGLLVPLLISWCTLFTDGGFVRWLLKRALKKYNIACYGSLKPDQAEALVWGK